MNKWRWSVIIQLVRIFADADDEDSFYTIIDGKQQTFVLENHVGTHKMFVNSGQISLNYSTTVESDVDVTLDSTFSSSYRK